MKDMQHTTEHTQRNTSDSERAVVCVCAVCVGVVWCGVVCCCVVVVCGGCCGVVNVSVAGCVVLLHVCCLVVDCRLREVGCVIVVENAA